MTAGNMNNVLPPFLSKTYDMVDDSSTDSIVSWGNANNTFVVFNATDFSKHILPKYFKHNNFSSFVRQLNTYGFRKVDPDRWEFAHEGFLRGQKQLLTTISRRKSAHANGNSQQPSKVQKSSVGACVEVGKFGLDEEVERLKRDKNVLMQELVRLSQQQQSTDNQLQNVGQRVQVMEQRQQQMMSFLAKAMHSPGFMTQFSQQQNDSNRHVTAGKKRRLQRQEEDSLATKNTHNPPLDGRVVKYQPSINEAAKTLFSQMCQMNNSARMDSSIKNRDSFLIDDVPTAIPLDSSSSSTQVSGVTLSEIPPITGQSCIAAESNFPVSCMTNSMSEVQSSLAVLTDCVKAAEVPELTAHNCLYNDLDFDKVQGMSTENRFMNPDQNFVGSVTEIDEGLDVLSAVLDGTQSLEADSFSPDANGMSKLPGINDELWDMFFTPSPLTGDTDEVEGSSLGYGLTKDQELSLEKEIQLEKMDKKQHMDHLTQQMELLSSDPSLCI